VASSSHEILKNSRVGAVILGAGFGRRFGSDKRRASFGASTVAETTLKNFSEVFASIRVVLKSDDYELAHILSQHAEIVYTDQAHLGMGHSLSAGFEDLNWQWAFIGLLDMPFLQPAILRRIAMQSLSTRQLIIRPVFKASNLPVKEKLQGHPIGIHNKLFPQVHLSRGDQGAKWLLEAHASAIEEIEISDPGIIMDIDRPADLSQKN
jgi:molybdenum cofactor cytidylyltransferase